MHCRSIRYHPLWNDAKNVLKKLEVLTEAPSWFPCPRLTDSLNRLVKCSLSSLCLALCVFPLPLILLLALLALHLICALSPRSKLATFIFLGWFLVGLFVRGAMAYPQESPVETIYRALTRKNSLYVSFIMVGAILGERVCASALQTHLELDLGLSNIL
jgi:hypothetical protein